MDFDADAQSDPIPADGYPKLAEEMARIPSKIHFSTFLAAGVEVQLHAQAEIISLLQHYRRVQEEDATHPDVNRRVYTRDWTKMACSGRQHKLAVELRAKLDAYMDRSIRLHHTCRLPSTNKANDLHAVQDFLSLQFAEERDLLGPDAATWGTFHEREAYNPELRAIQARFPKDEDMLTRWMAATAATGLVFWLKKGKPDPGKKTLVSDDDKVQPVTIALQSTLAGVLPMAAVVTLYNIEQTGTRLTTLGIANILFVWSVTLLVRARPIELFGVSAAFLAVGIVFIATTGSGISDLGSNNNSGPS